MSETDTEVIPKLLKFAYDSMAAEQGGIGKVPFPTVSNVPRTAGTKRQQVGSAAMSCDI